MNKRRRFFVEEIPMRWENFIWSGSDGGRLLPPPPPTWRDPKYGWMTYYKPSATLLQLTWMLLTRRRQPPPCSRRHW
jgi:hypothetical protein